MIHTTVIRRNTMENTHKGMHSHGFWRHSIDLTTVKNNYNVVSRVEQKGAVDLSHVQPPRTADIK